MRDVRRTLGALMALAVVVTALAAAPMGDQSGSSPKLTIFFSGSVSGNYGPCGCKKNPTGGLARRAGVVERYRQEHSDAILQIDVGNYLYPLGPPAPEVNRMMMRGIADLPLAVVNLGAEDLLQRDFLWEQAPADTAVISTNLVPRDPAGRAPQKYAVVRVPGSSLGLARDLRIGFVGLTDPSRVRPNSGFRGLDPIQSVAEVKDEILKEADFIVALADIPRDTSQIGSTSLIRKLADTYPEIYAVLLTERRFVLFPPVQINNAIVLSAIERGRWLSRLTFGLDAQGKVQDADYEAIELKEGVPENAAFRKMQDALSVKYPPSE